MASKALITMPPCPETTRFSQCPIGATRHIAEHAVEPQRTQSSHGKCCRTSSHVRFHHIRRHTVETSFTRITPFGSVHNQDIFPKAPSFCGGPLKLVHLAWSLCSSAGTIVDVIGSRNEAFFGWNDNGREKLGGVAGNKEARGMKMPQMMDQPGDSKQSMSHVANFHQSNCHPSCPFTGMSKRPFH